MYFPELSNQIIADIKPSMIDIEMAERAILEELSSSPLSDMQYADVSAIVSRVHTRLRVEKWPVPAGIQEIQPDPNYIKTQLVTREALQRLHASGTLIAFGCPKQEAEAVLFRVFHSGGNGPIGDKIYLPAVYLAYHVATPFRVGQRFRLTSGDVYLSHINQARLPSRAKRCLRESVEAFKKGLYLSASIGVGAASESLWMSFGRLVLSKKLPGYPKLDELFKKGYPNVGEVLKQTWNILISECNPELKQIFPMRGEQDTFKNYTDGVLELRNYALHNEDADEDEPRFTYEETGLLLLRSANYFNQLTRLMEAVDKKP